MSNWQQKIEAQIAEVADNPEGARYVLISKYRLQALLDVAVAAELYMKTSAASVVHHPREQKLFAALDKLWEVFDE